LNYGNKTIVNGGNIIIVTWYKSSAILMTVDGIYMWLFVRFYKNFHSRHIRVRCATIESISAVDADYWFLVLGACALFSVEYSSTVKSWRWWGSWQNIKYASKSTYLNLVCAFSLFPMCWALRFSCFNICD